MTSHYSGGQIITLLIEERHSNRVMYFNSLVTAAVSEMNVPDAITMTLSSGDRRINITIKVLCQCYL